MKREEKYDWWYCQDELKDIYETGQKFIARLPEKYNKFKEKLQKFHSSKDMTFQELSKMLLKNVQKNNFSYEICGEVGREGDYYYIQNFYLMNVGLLIDAEHFNFAIEIFSYMTEDKSIVPYVLSKVPSREALRQQKLRLLYG